MRLNFSASVLRNVNRVKREINDKCYSITRELFESIVSLTPSPNRPGPYADGLLVNQWYPKVGEGFSNELTNWTSDDGAGSRLRINSLKGNEFLGKNGRISLANNVHYGFRAEYAGWPTSDDPRWKNAKPYRMIALSLQKVAAKHR